MKIIKAKLKESLIELSRKVQINDSDTIWIESRELLTQTEFQKAQGIINEIFSINRTILVNKGCKLKFEKEMS